MRAPLNLALEIMKYIAGLPNRSRDKGVLSMRYLIAVCLALVLALGIAHSQEPPKGKVKQQKPAAEQRSTEQAPLFEKTPDPTTQAERDYEHYEKFEKPKNERRITNATIALAWITGFLAFFTFGLWIVTYYLVKDAKDTAKRQLRAYLSPHILTHGNFGDRIRPFRPEFKIRNSGQTPAHDVTVRIKTKILPYPSHEALPTPDPWHGSFVIGPNSEVNICCELDKLLTDGEREEIKAGTRQRIYVWGDVNYVDAFGSPQSIDFCLFFGGLHCEQLGMQWAPSGNKTT